MRLLPIIERIRCNTAWVQIDKVFVEIPIFFCEGNPPLVGAFMHF